MILVLVVIGDTIGRDFVMDRDSCSFNGAMANLLLVHSWGIVDWLTWNYPSWSISAEWFAYLVVLVVGIRWLARRSRVWHLLLVLLLWIGMLLYAWNTGGGLDRFTTNSLVRVSAEFLAGCLLYRFVHTYKANRLTNLSFVFGFGFFVALTQFDIRFEILLLPLIVLSLYSLWSGSVLGRAAFGNPVIVYLGEISYSIYMVHPIVQFAGNYIVREIDPATTPKNAWIILTLQVASVLLLSTVTYYSVEKPARRLVIKLYDHIRPWVTVKTAVLVERFRNRP